MRSASTRTSLAGWRARNRSATSDVRLRAAEQIEHRTVRVLGVHSNLLRLGIDDQVESFERNLPDKRCRPFREHERVAAHEAPEDLETNPEHAPHLQQATIGEANEFLLLLAKSERTCSLRRDREHGCAGVHQRFELDRAD